MKISVNQISFLLVLLFCVFSSALNVERKAKSTDHLSRLPHQTNHFMNKSKTKQAIPPKSAENPAGHVNKSNSTNESNETKRMVSSRDDLMNVVTLPPPDRFFNPNKSAQDNAPEDGNLVTKETQNKVGNLMMTEQKYFMLRINLLGIGFRVINDIIPVPITDIAQFTEDMEFLLAKMHQVQEISGKSYWEGHNITLGGAERMQMKMNPDGTLANGTSNTLNVRKAFKNPIHIVIFIGIFLAFIALCCAMCMCKKTVKRSDADRYESVMQPFGRGISN